MIWYALTISLKEAAAKKLRFRITGFSQAEYWYLLSNKGYIMSYQNYNISKADSFLKCLENTLQQKITIK